MRGMKEITHSTLPVFPAGCPEVYKGHTMIAKKTATQQTRATKPSSTSSCRKSTACFPDKRGPWMLLDGELQSTGS